MPSHESKPYNNVLASHTEEDAIVLRRLVAKKDWLTMLKKCPVSMDDVPPRRREIARRRKL